jgi:formylglycine-generating enzyme required for sulfatase activity
MTTGGLLCPPIPRQATWLLKLATVLLVFGLGSTAMGQTTQSTIAFYSCYDLETGEVASEAFPVQCQPHGDITWDYNADTTVHARLSWNAEYVDVAFVAKAYDDVTDADISQSYFCEHANDQNPGCQDADPHSALGDERSAILLTGDGNYFKAGFISESDTDGVVFEYELLITGPARDFHSGGDDGGGDGGDDGGADGGGDGSGGGSGEPPGDDPEDEPLLINCPSDASISCEDSLETVADLASAVGGCPGTIDITHVDGGTGPPACGTLSRTWTATDSCGNSASCMQTITVGDLSAPIVDCPPDATVNCQDNSSSVSTGMATVTDNCGVATFTESDSVVASSCPLGEHITRTWTATDDCGNTSNCSQVVTIADHEAPVISCPPDVTVTCDQIDNSSSVSTGVATATDNCDINVSIGESDSVAAGSCPPEEEITRTWIATDSCGNLSSCEQIITVVDDEPPMITCPDDITVACEDDRSSVNTGVATTGGDNCNSDVTITDCCDGCDAFIDTDDIGISVINEGYSLGYEIVMQEDVTINQIGVPFVSGTFYNPDYTLPGLGEGEDEYITYYGNNGPANVGVYNSTGELILTVVVENGQVDNGFEYVDIEPMLLSSGETYYFVLITETDNVYSSFGGSITYNSAFSVQQIISTNTNGDTSLPAFFPPENHNSWSLDDNYRVVNFKFDCFNDGCEVITRTWTATDDCGNASNCSQTVTIADHEAPAITCPDDVTASCEDDRTSANTGVATATDNCDDGELYIAESDSVVAGSCPQKEVITRIWTATDDCGNASSCGQIITVVDDQAPDVICPDNVTIELNTSSDPGDTGYASVSDNCDNYPMVTWHDTTDPYEMDDEYPTIFRSWTGTDECGNSTVCDQEISWNDNPYLSYWSPANGASEVHPEARLEFVVDPVPTAMQIVSGYEDEGREGPDEEQVTYDLFVGQGTVTIEEFLDGLNNLHADHPDEIQFRANGNVVFQDGGPAILLFDMDQNNNVTVTGIEEELFDNGITYNPTGEPAYDADQARKNFPILGLTWYGTVYYCNWLTMRKEDKEERAYATGPDPADWRPASLSKADWQDGFNDSEREAWIQQYPDSYRLPMDDYAVGASRYNEFFHFVGDFGEGVESGENDDRVNYWNSGDFFDNGPVPLDYSVANEFGLDNVLGNVWEWQTDTFDPQDLSARSLRGASWYSNQELIDPAKRIAADPGSGFADVGFRVVARNDAVWEVEIAENAEFTDSTVLTMAPGFSDLNGNYASRTWELSLAPSTDYFWRVRGSHSDVGLPAEFSDLSFGAPWDSPMPYATFRTSHQVREPALQLNLAGEWNLVSVNVDPDHNVAHPKHLFGADSTAWGWDSEQQIYFRLYEIKPFEGFWIHVPEPGTVEVSGFTPEPEIEIRHGWNLLGPLNDGTALPSPSQLRGEVMQYLNGGYESADILDTGIGYWMFFIADFVHDLSGGDGDEEVE